MIVGVASSSLRASTPAASSAQPSHQAAAPQAVAAQLANRPTDQVVAPQAVAAQLANRPTDQAAAPQAAAAHLANRPAGSSSAEAGWSHATASMTDAVTRRLVGHDVHLTNQPMLGPPTRQLQHDRPDSRPDPERAADAALRPASPPFFFEADVSEESLVDFGGNTDDPDAVHPSMSVQAANNVSDARLAAVAQLHDPEPVHQALLHQQGAQRPAAPAAAQADSLTSTSQPSSHMQRPVPLTMPAAEPLPLHQRTSASAQLRRAGQASQRAHRDRLESNAHARLQQGEAVGTDGDDSKEDSKGCSGGAGDSKENEPVGMARAVRGPREGQPRGGRQAAAKPPKPVTSSKVRVTVSKHTVWCFAIKLSGYGLRCDVRLIIVSIVLIFLQSGCKPRCRVSNS